MDIKKASKITGGDLTLHEMNFLYDNASEISPKTLLEIGARQGSSSLVLGSIAKENKGMLYSIEPFPNDKWKPNIKEFKLSSNITPIKGRSPWIGHDFLKGNIDYIFIDGGHLYHEIFTDFYYYSHFLRIKGRIGFHDIATGHCKAAVNKVIDYAKEHGFSFIGTSAIDDKPLNNAGIGVIEKIKEIEYSNKNC